jgi:hypothetical protein
MNGKEGNMTARVYPWVLTGTLALAALAPASAQIGSPLWRPSLLDYTGVLTPTAYVPPRIPSEWITPQHVIHYAVPQPVFVPIRMPRPALQPVAVATVSLKSGVTQEGLHIGEGTVVMWENSGAPARTLIVYPAGSARMSAEAAPRGWQLPADGRFSLALHQRGSYEYYLLDEPERRGRIIVE